MESWRLVLGNGGYDSIRLEDLRIFVRDDLVRPDLHAVRAAFCVIRSMPVESADMLSVCRRGYVVRHVASAAADNDFLVLFHP